MHYPQFWRKIIDKLGMFSGFLIIIIAAFSVVEAALRYFFDSPTGWALNVCQYLLVYMIFMSSPYAFQEGGHVAVDMVLNAVDKRDKSGKRLPRRIMASIGYVFAAIFIGIIAYGAFELTLTAIEKSRMTSQIPVIPLWILYVPMVIGCIMMLLTLIFMIIDCLNTKTEGKYL